MTLAAIGSAVFGFAKRIPDWLWYVFIAIAAGFFIDMRARGQQRDKDRADFEKESREVESQVIKNINENTNEVIRESDAVRSRPAVVELPDGTTDLPDYHYRDR